MRKKTAVVILLLATVLLVSVSQAAPGTSDDPLVSKSYVDEKFNQLMVIISGNSETHTLTQSSYSPAAYVPVSAKKGQVLLGGEGAEIILRSGRAAGYCVGENGVVDVTDGVEIFNDMEIIPNHMIIVPRDDGRGVVILEDAWFIVKGGYTLH